MEAEVPSVRLSSKDPTSRETQEHEEPGHAVHRSWCVGCVDGCGVGGQHRIELLDEEERGKVTHDTRKMQTRSFFWLSRQQVWSDWSDMLNEKKGPTAYSISFLVGFIEDLVFFAVSVFHVVL